MIRGLGQWNNVRRLLIHGTAIYTTLVEYLITDHLNSICAMKYMQFLWISIDNDIVKTRCSNGAGEREKKSTEIYYGFMAK